ncbi:hypothetical protein ED312_08520 [Sinomicrobium pectinilyticum]|uniref:Uncharacterized protein n=1 Tax=Sinomicrobium pectinilyticum TaxID=1084421 RepID=A0A3N0EL32_SINP1|nr:hypothetical protein [Sinomicrobium pectinilyticum]RNL88482.1 hypothetical protein ED312_08520 [Sinomicrobium pectinilyticum]
MKKFACLIAGAVMMLFSCSTDETLYHDTVGTSNALSQELHFSPDNNKNPYDPVGELYRRALKQYVKTGKVPSQHQLEMEINSLLPDGRLPGIRPVPATTQSHKTETVSDDSWQTLEVIISGSGLSPAAQAGLLDFIETLLVIQYDVDQALHNYITGYESLVMGHPSLTETDKRVVLTFTALVRHASYPDMDEEPVVILTEQDDDWDYSMGNIVSFMIIALEDGVEGISRAMYLSLNRDQ